MNTILCSIGCVAVFVAPAALAPAAAVAGDAPVVRAATPAGVDLGMRLEESADRRLLRVAAVEPEGVAASAGIEIGDVIVALDGRAMGSGREAADYLAGVAPGRRVQLDLDRRGRSERLFVVVDPVAVAGGAGVRRVATPALAPLRSLDDDAVAPAADGLHGVRFVSLSPGLGRYFGTDRGVLVVQAARDNPLRLEDGDVLQSIDGRVPGDVDEALDLLSAVDVRGRTVLDVLREHRTRRIEVTWSAAAPPAVHRRRLDPSSSPRPDRGD